MLNAIRNWALIGGIGTIMLVNVAVTSHLTRESLAETPFDVSSGNIDASLGNEMDMADLDPRYFETVEVVDLPARDEATRVTRRRPDTRPLKLEHISRSLSTRASRRRPTKLFEPIVITYAGPAAVKSMASKAQLYRVRPGDDSFSAQIKPHQKDPFVLKMIKKPYDLLKAFASRLR